MDARKMLELIKTSIDDGSDRYALAAKIVEAQKESDAQIAKDAGSEEIAALIMEA